MAKRQNASFIYEQLWEGIMSGQLKAGERIPESRLAGAFGVSRPPVHAALLQLEQDGLVELAPNSSARVACYSEPDLHEIGTLRLSLDAMAVRLALLYGSRADFLALQKCAEDCARGMETGDGRLRRDADCDFHLLLAQISRNRLLHGIQAELYTRVNFILLTHQDAVEYRDVHIQEHFALIEALSRHDAERAHAVITHHLASFYGLEKRYPPGFFLAI